MCRMRIAPLAAQLGMMRMSAGPAMPCLVPYCKGPSCLHHLQILKPQQAQVTICECDLGPVCMLVAIVNKQCWNPNAIHACCSGFCPSAVFVFSHCWINCQSMAGQSVFTANLEFVITLETYAAWQDKVCSYPNWSLLRLVRDMQRVFRLHVLLLLLRHQAH